MAFKMLLERASEAREIPPPAPDSFLPLPAGWEALGPHRDAVWFRELARNAAEDRQKHGDDLLPAPGLELEALRLCPLDRVRVIILGQDPYPHSAACGLAFSVSPGNPLPPSARAIQEELALEGYGSDAVGLDLRPWAEAGCLLLNHTLTVVRGKPRSCYHRGWETLTETIIRLVLARDEERWHAYRRSCERAGLDPLTWKGKPPVPAVFLALGSWARGALNGSTGALCVPSDQLVCVPHPAAREGQFRGSRPFSLVDLRLASAGAPPFPWRLPAPREKLFAALRAAWTLPPEKGKALLERAVEEAAAAGFGDPVPSVRELPPSQIDPSDRRRIAEAVEFRAAQAALARLSDAVCAIVDAGRLLRAETFPEKKENR